MNKLFVCVPIHKRDLEDIEKSVEAFKVIAEAFYDKKFEIINKYEHRPRLLYSIICDQSKMLDDAEYFVGVGEYSGFEECDILSGIARDRGMKMHIINDWWELCPDLLVKE